MACGGSSLAASAFGALPALATNGSDLQVTLTDTGVDPGGASGSVRLRAQSGEASLSLRLLDVSVSPVHLCLGENESNLSARAELLKASRNEGGASLSRQATQPATFKV